MANLPPPRSTIPVKSEAIWLQFDSSGSLCLRVVTTGSDCPFIESPKGFPPLTQRAAASRAFPVTVWEASLPADIKEISIEGLSLCVPDSYTRIAIVGDTGCRPAQGCSPEKWPFQQVAEKMVAEKPNLAIHTGDYIYRHMHAQQKCCPHHIHTDEGDNWEGWQKEFFSPLAKVLHLIPWVFIRGNQETDGCASEGWRRFLDGYPFVDQEVDYTPPYVIALDKVNLIVHDSANICPDHDQVWPDNQLEGLSLPGPNPAWLLTHRPLWGIVNDQKHNDDIPVIIMNEHANLQQFLEPFPESLATIFSGHIHAFQVIKLFAHDIHQFVIGNSGVALEEDRPPEVLRNTRLEGHKIEEAYSLVVFGYGLAEYEVNVWNLQCKNLKGEILEIFPCKPVGIDRNS